MAEMDSARVEGMPPAAAGASWSRSRFPGVVVSPPRWCADRHPAMLLQLCTPMTKVQLKRQIDDLRPVPTVPSSGGRLQFVRTGHGVDTIGRP